MPFPATRPEPEQMTDLPAKGGFHPPAKHLQFPLLDSVRALAAISILLVHTALFSEQLRRPRLRPAPRPPGHRRPVLLPALGVPSLPPVRRRAGRGASRGSASPTTRRRRFLRIAPAYWLALTVAALLPGMAGALERQLVGVLRAAAELSRSTPRPGSARPSPALWHPGRLEPQRSRSPSTSVLPLYALAMAWMHAPAPGLVARHRDRGACWRFCDLGRDPEHPAGHRRPALGASSRPLGRGWWFALGMALAATLRLGWPGGPRAPCGDLAASPPLAPGRARARPLRRRRGRDPRSLPILAFPSPASSRTSSSSSLFGVDRGALPPARDLRRGIGGRPAPVLALPAPRLARADLLRDLPLAVPGADRPLRLRHRRRLARGRLPDPDRRHPRADDRSAPRSATTCSSAR